MHKRPNPGESEDDILQQEREFLQSKMQPAVKLIKSDFASKISNDPIQTDKKDEARMETTLIGKIVEKQTSKPVKNFSTTVKFAKGFPQAKRRQITGASKNGSIFSQQNVNQIKETVETQMEITETPSTSNTNLPAQSCILSGKDSQQIHSENLNALSKMSEEEILEEQKKLLSTLDPNLIQFLKSKRKKTQDSNITVETMKTEVLEEKNENEPSATLEEINTPKEIIDNADADKWMHFNVVEAEKMQWMKNIEIPKIKEYESYEARFNFYGWLQKYSVEEISEKNRILYHHGEEPGRPGYTLKELFKLCRSDVIQQRILALRTISNILSLFSSGTYDDIIEIPIEQIFFVVRLCVDENVPTVLNAALKALHSLFFYQVDEVCLDCIQGFGYAVIQPMLTVDKETNDNDQDIEMNDQQMAELDLVKCLVRTDILQRIRYIINTVQPGTESIIYCLEILIRIMRDSQKIAIQAYNTEDLFKSIIKYFLPKIYKLEDTTDNCYNKPLLQVIKLLRIAACRSKTIAEDLIKRHQVIDSLLSYISNQITENIKGVKIQTESFKLITVFFRYKLGIGYFSDLQPFILHYIDYHYKKTDCNYSSSYTLQNHFAGLMGIISEMSKIISVNLVSNFIPILMQCLVKYCAQVSNSSRFLCGKLQIISSLIVTLTNILKYRLKEEDNSMNELILDLVSSSGFSAITENIIYYSNLLCEFKPHKTSSNFISLEVSLRYNTELILPILNTNSCIPFLTSLSYYIENSENNDLIMKFIQHPNINKYLMKLKAEDLYLSNNWLTKYESQLILNILKCTVKVQNQLSNLFSYYELTVKCLSIFNIEQSNDIDFLLQNIVFNKKYYPNEILLNELSITVKKEEILNILSYLNEIYDCYCDVIGLKKDQFSLKTSFTLDVRIGNIVPVDWIFSPIVSLHSKFEEDSLKTPNENKQILIVTRCLQWIVLYEEYFPTLSLLINTTDRFCRLSCVFLCSNSLFLENDIHCLLEKCFKVLIMRDNFEYMDFERPIQGLNNFQDFYAQLLEQYEGVSYGDALFANFILVPCAQRHNVKWRKMLWSEYMGAAQSIIIDENQCLIDVKEFLEPPEYDLSIIKCYKRALISGQLTRSPLLKRIASFHVDNILKNVQPTTK